MTNTFGTTVSNTPSGPSIGTVARLGAALAVFVSGLTHLQLYFDGYRDFPDENLGRSFILNAVASVVLAIALVFRTALIVRVATAALLIGTLIAFVLSRTDNGIFGFSERSLNPSPQAVLALVGEIVGLLLLIATLVPAIGPGAPLALAPAAVAGGLALVAAIGGAVLWAREEDRTATGSAPAPTTAAPAPTTTTTAAATTTTAAATTTTVVATTTADAPTTTADGATSTSSGLSPTTVAPTTTATPATTAPPATTAAPSTSTTVSIVDFEFAAQTLEVPVGTTVEWVNNDSFAHSVVANDDSFRSADLAPGDRFSFTFTTAGTFDYICGIHPSMLGSIVVTG